MRKVIELDKGAYKLLIEVDIEDELTTELPEIGEGVAQVIADAVEKSKIDNKKKKKN
jgi:hypothetical protein